MSSAGIVIPPGATVAASAAIAELTAAAAGVLTVWAADVLAVRAVEGSGGGGEEEVAGRSAVHNSEVIWEDVAVDVVGLNARIMMVADRTSGASTAAVLPKPLSLTGRTAAEAARWCRESERLLDAEVRIARAWFRAEDASPEAVAAVQGLNPDADEQALLSVLEAARTVTARETQEADVQLRALRRLAATVNVAVADHRLAAQRWPVLGDSAVAGGRSPSLFTDVVVALRDIAAGRARLKPALRSLSSEAVAWAGDKIHQCFIAETMRACMAELGYHPDGDFHVEVSADVGLSRPEWNGEHSAEIWMDRRGMLYGRLAHETAVHGEAALRERAVA
ncbi:hypothetical protein Caci_6956 [Catenulispora acidiphila DSM 44928]|uniref:Uncharacterized protein n=1 Tax=Catenulispora acidiphila (strain DSM 44928 / JCM 14897 / NBRC 102108 / NRRL B-24433 / ID139908) TaxID=479433 RepID=C7Q3M2_CATAD|nr:hypothetical protein [Catenulispora acidiphila]ACU75787.1 hypothetical protein Caci_6956 [Catenulispora acidiphila DSM 44928]